MNENLTNCVKKFQSGLISKREFLKTINPIILKTPIYLGNKCLDIKHEFYAFIIAKIDKIISSYKIIPGTNFITWFNIVLKREFIYFISKLNKFNEFESLQIDEAINNYSLEYKENLSTPDKPSIDFSILTEKEKDIISLKYGININELDISKSIDQILKKMDKKRNMEKTLTKKYFKIIKLQKMILRTNDFNEKSNLKTELERTIFYKRKLEKIFNSYNVLPTDRWVGDQLNKSAGTISARLYKIRKKLLKNYYF